MALKTEYSFNLPRGFVDDKGTLHKEGIMRLATAADEILPLKDQSPAKPCLQDNNPSFPRNYKVRNARRCQL